jgi:hypothetical protein
MSALLIRTGLLFERRNRQFFARFPMVVWRQLFRFEFSEATGHGDRGS